MAPMLCTTSPPIDSLVVYSARSKLGMAKGQKWLLEPDARLEYSRMLSKSIHAKSDQHSCIAKFTI